MRRFLLGHGTTAVRWIVAQLVAAWFAVVRLLPPARASALGGALGRLIGPLLPANRIARDNLRAALPELTDAARAAVLRECWDNLGRDAFEYTQIDRMATVVGLDGPDGHIDASDEVIAKFVAMRDDGQPALIFSAHLANWEMTAVVASRWGLASAALFRAPNNPFIARGVLAVRRRLMGELIPAGTNAPFRMATLLEEGCHVGMLVDQRFGRGTRVKFFGRRAPTNPIFAKLARHMDCPVYGARAIRLPDARFRLELEGPFDLPRDARGRIDEKATTAFITNVVERWVREHPGQWLWQHRRWQKRNEVPPPEEE